MIRPRPTFALRLLTATALVAAVLVGAEPAVAVTVPKTLADQRPVQVGPVEPGFPIDHVGVIWDDDDHHGHAHAAEGPGGHGAVRFRTDGRWGPWIDLVPDGADAEGQWASGLVAAGDADAYQVRGVPAGAGAPRAVALNTTDGPAVQIGERPAGAVGALTSCRSRAEWGADESLRTDLDGEVVWPAAFYPVQTLTVHHTATKNDDRDPAATVRAIYRYHAIDRGWGDIGYQYLIDEAGVVYEGRWSGSDSLSCSEGGAGADFGHETDADDGDLDGDGTVDEMVTGAHVGGWNSGNVGVSLLGDFTRTEPKAAAVDSLEQVLTELSGRHGIDPKAKLTYVNPVNGATKAVDAISGHKDWEPTQCPGDRLHRKLPTIRDDVAAALASGGGDSGGSGGTSPTLEVLSLTPNQLPKGQTAVAIDGTGFVDGATVSFLNGKGSTPTATAPTYDSTTGHLQTTVTVEPKGPSGYWDVRVTLPDGRSDDCSRCAYVTR